MQDSKSINSNTQKYTFLGESYFDIEQNITDSSNKLRCPILHSGSKHNDVCITAFPAQHHINRYTYIYNHVLIVSRQFANDY